MNNNDKINSIVSDIESLIDKINLFYEKLYYLDIMRADVDEIHDIKKDILEEVNIINEKYNDIKMLCYEVNESKIKIINSHRIMETDINKIKLEMDKMIIDIDNLEKENLNIKAYNKSLSDSIKSINDKYQKIMITNNKKFKELDDYFKKNILSLNKRLIYSNIIFILLFIIFTILKFLGRI